MKLTLLAIALALPCLAQASYSMKIPLENAQGGALENNSIVFSKPATTPTNPVEPVEPEIADPFAPENPDCDPMAQDYPGNVTGKELVWDDGYYNADGTMYRSCKLKATDDSNILARYVSGIDADYTSSSGLVNSANKCNPNSSLTTVGSGTCKISITYFSIPFNVSSNGDGSYNYTNKPVYFFIPSKATFGYDDIGRIEIDGHVCSNLRQYSINTMFGVKWSEERICDLDASYESLRDKVAQPFIVTIYKK
ncbi:hypothetical protein E6W26_29160 [Pseudomonas aeruginosa]|uniref:hypothetical protein n=1 Tax=Pseudomonas aeruginosa TaxID=287 RepID=UPI00109DA56E|nr:hypothetical protein [Pseudomonas aeruginosa]EKV1241255.1 hypothetical protein [Pseudomonas aeruginosa]EKV8586164.1 hypothetical protein [Pseudomonas aeruginosa]ELN5407382.1 hypothetical protein [Pseudomonas aeruginosa]ELP1438573.1 hypothetical protein [Pseudomonas aeruginosa]THB16469.1 hypothetical protein E6W26_29160 [Pseudomonas aeruginosa]